MEEDLSEQGRERKRSEGLYGREDIGWSRGRGREEEQWLD
jgi:hypothetical protein